MGRDRRDAAGQRPGGEPGLPLRHRQGEHDEVQEPRKGLYLEEAIGTIETYLRGISGRELTIEPHEESYTDTETVFLPRIVAAFRDNARNFALLELMVAHKWAQIAQGTLAPSRRLIRKFVGGDASSRPDIETLFARFPERRLALDLYNIIEAFRLEHFLRAELPGLMRAAETINRELLRERPSPDTLLLQAHTAHRRR